MKARYIAVGWRQLKHNRLRMFAAVLGITFAVVLMLVQQGFRAALFDSGIRWHNALQYDIVILSPKTEYLLEAARFPAHPHVAGARCGGCAGGDAGVHPAGEVAQSRESKNRLADFRRRVRPGR